MATQGLSVIELQVEKVGQLFNTLDPVPFRENELDCAAEDYIVGWARELPHNATIRIMIHMPAAEDSGEPAKMLPRRLTNPVIDPAHLDAYLRWALPAMRKMEKVVKPRFSRLTYGVPARAAGAMCLVLAIIITLPVPLGHLVPGAAISLMGLGLIEHDGLVIIAGLLIGDWPCWLLLLR